MHRGEIYLVDLSSYVGSEQSGMRPALIVQNEIGNMNSPTTIICPLTSKAKPNMDTHLVLTPEDCGIIRESTLLCEQIRVVDKSRLKRKVGELTNKQKIEDVNKRLMISLGIGV